MSAGVLTDEQVLDTLSVAQNMKEEDESKLQSLRDRVDEHVNDLGQKIEDFENSQEKNEIIFGAAFGLAVAGVATLTSPEVAQAVGSVVENMALTTGLTSILEQGVDQIVEGVSAVAASVGTTVAGLGLAKAVTDHKKLEEMEAMETLQDGLKERVELLDQVLEGESIDLSSVEEKSVGESVTASPERAISTETSGRNI